MKTSIVILVLLSATLVVAQTGPDTSWTRTYGGTAYDEAYAMEITSDGYYLFAGYGSDQSGFGPDFYLVKTDTNGDTLWTRWYGGSSTEVAYDVIECSDGSYAMAGYTWSYGPGLDNCYVVNVEAGGDTNWTSVFGNPNSIYDHAHAIDQTTNGDYIVAGKTLSDGYYDFYLVRLDDYGDTLWSQHYGGSADDEAYDALQTNDGGFIMAGYSWSFGYSADFYVVKTDSVGDTLWTRTFDSWMDDYARSILATTDGGYVIAGYAGYSGTMNSSYIVKIDSIGDVLWTRTIYGLSYNEAYSIHPTIDGGFIVAGKSEPYMETHSYLVKLDSLGNTQWTQSYFDYSSVHNAAFDVRQVVDGGFVLAGWKYNNAMYDYDLFIIKTEPDPILLTPNPPVVTISIEGNHARLTWDPVTESVYGFPISIYMHNIYNSTSPGGPFNYLDFVGGNDTTYVHYNVLPTNPTMYYQVTADPY